MNPASVQRTFNKVLETFCRDLGPYWHDSITQLQKICGLHMEDEKSVPPHLKDAEGVFTIK